MADPTKFQDGPAKNNNTKKWLIGCGGCLVVVLIMIGIAVAVGVGCMNEVKKVSDQSVQAVLGDYKPPSNYVVLGLPLQGEGGINHGIMLMDLTRGAIIAIADTTVSETEATELKKFDPKATEDYIKRMGDTLNSSSQSTGKSSDFEMKDTTFKSVTPLALTNGKAVYAVNMNLNHRKGTSPGVALVLPMANNRVVLLFGMDARTTSSDPNASFDGESQQLQSELLTLVNDSSLDDQLTTGPAK